MRFVASAADDEGRTRHERLHLGDLLLGTALPDPLCLGRRSVRSCRLDGDLEYREVAARIGSRFHGVDLGPVLDRIALHALLVVPVKLPDDACTDRDDMKFLECALASRADCIISGDRALPRSSGCEGIEVVTPREFVGKRLRR